MVTAAEDRVRVSVVGLGAWGTALALHCARQGHDVVAWHRDPTRVRELNAGDSLRVSATSFPKPTNIRVTSELAECGGADLAIVALPASAWHDVVPALTAKVLISATKGLEKTSGLTPLQYAHERLGRGVESLCVISGPSFASDLAAEAVKVSGARSSLTHAAQAATPGIPLRVMSPNRGLNAKSLFRPASQSYSFTQRLAETLSAADAFAVS